MVPGGVPPVLQQRVVASNEHGDASGIWDDRDVCVMSGTDYAEAYVLSHV